MGGGAIVVVLGADEDVVGGTFVDPAACGGEHADKKMNAATANAVTEASAFVMMPPPFMFLVTPSVSRTVPMFA